MTSRFTDLLDSFDFAKSAYEEVGRLHVDAFLERRRDVKWLVEEVLPLAVFAQHLRNPELHVAVRWFPDTSSRDAEVKLAGAPVERGFYPPHYFIEITTATSRHEYLRREALRKTGFVFGGSNIHRDANGNLVSKPEVRDGDQPVRDAAEWIIERVEAKLLKNYPDDTLLLVNMLTDRRLSIPDWAAIHEAVAATDLKTRFKGVWAVDAYHSDVVLLPVQNSQ